MSGERDALVIGGGFAGVAAAVALRARGLSVAILDDRATLGGRARSDVLGGVTIDTGAQLAATSFARTMRLLARDGEAPHAEGGATPALRIAPGRDVLVRGEERHPIQFGSLRSLLAFGALGASEKMKLGAQLVPLIARHRRTLDAAATEIPPELDRESARAFMERAVGPRAADALVETAFNSFYAATGAELSLAFYLTLGRYG
ncbi:MAG TPA: NAD(P)-binding protein, partial [Gemmatimonadaceae bacterium]|nr:NAD(P)-binding protein [Gemmatimonadaceae bacterium]